MNYQKVYDSIIEKRKAETPTGYTERHHIIPRSLGGSDDKSNLVRLTAREHYICHLLLVYIHRDDRANFHKMVKAAMMMVHCNGDFNQRDYLCNSRLYDKLKKAHAEAMSASQSGSSNSNFGSRWFSNRDLRECRMFAKGVTPPDGWVPGRITNWEFLDKTCSECGVHLNLQTNRELRKYCEDCGKEKRTQGGMLATLAAQKRCMIGGIEYISVRHASDETGVSYQTLISRFNSTSATFADYVFI